MDFFNKLTKKAKETYEGASKKTGELAKEAKLRMKMNENKSEINDLYQEIGKKVYEKHTLSEEIRVKIDLEEECTKIDILSAEIETCLNQIRELKDKKQCPKCYNEIDLASKFCNFCGEKQDEEKVCEVEVVDAKDEQEKSNDVEAQNEKILEEQVNLDNKEENPEVPNNGDNTTNNQS